MSKKRTSTESSTDEQIDREGGSDVSQQDGDTKRAKLVSLSDTTLEDLPLELVEHILIKAILTEVEEMHLAKSVWQRKADLVINRLSTVCPHWNNILTSNFFRKELCRTLDRTVERTNRMKILLQSTLPDFASEAISFKDELFMLCYPEEDGKDRYINVYDRNNMAEVKDVIPLPEMSAGCMVACSVSNCVYILNFIEELGDDKVVVVFRITKKEGEHQFRISPLISGRRSNGRLKISDIYVAGNGNIILCHRDEDTAKVVVYDANGSRKHKIKFSDKPLPILSIFKVIPKSDGNLVLVTNIYECFFGTMLTEIDMNGIVVRQYVSSLMGHYSVCQANQHGHIAIVGRYDKIELVDQEFNLLKVIRPQVDDFCLYSSLDYDRERNELSAILGHPYKSHVLYTFQFVEE